MTDLSSHLRKKNVNILITNVCNVNCLNCFNLCNLFPKKDYWFIPVDQLRQNIQALSEEGRPVNTWKGIGLFGGEPTLHPDWDEIINMLIIEFSNRNFTVFTNGSNPKKITALRGTNVKWKISKKDKSTVMNFVNVLDAPVDFLKIEDRKHYWELAKKNCRIWGKCRAVIYDNRAYICDPSGSFDRILLGEEKWGESCGWEVGDTDPFEGRSDEEIIEQAKHFCYRCGFCLGESEPNTEQRATVTNFLILKKNE